VRCSGFAWRLRQKKDEKKHGRKRSHATNARATRGPWTDQALIYGIRSPLMG